MTEASTQKTPLHALHVELGARMAPFAGYDMPIQFPAGVLAEHLHTRNAAGLFDVSHMGQALIEGADHVAPASFLESLCPADILNLAPGRQRYTQLLNENGGNRRRPHGDAAAWRVGNAETCRQRSAQRPRLRPDPPTTARRPLADAASRSGADRASGASRHRDIGKARSSRGDRDHGVHERETGADRGIRDLRLALRLYGRRRLRDLDRVGPGGELCPHSAR